MTIELYHADYSTCSQKVRLVLHEKALEFTTNEINFHKQEQLFPEYLKINPNGVVPTLIHNGEIIVDSSCIVEYLDEVFPEPFLSPVTPLGRARMRAWLRFVEEVPTVAVRIPSFDDVLLPFKLSQMSSESFEKSAEKRTLRKRFYGKMNSGKGFDQVEIENSLCQLTETVNRMNLALTNQPWILGPNFTLVDSCLAPLIDRIDDLGMRYMWNKYPNVQQWFDRVRSRSSFAKAFYQGSRLSERQEFCQSVTASRKKYRNYYKVLDIE